MNTEQVPLSELAMQLTLALNNVPMTDEDMERGRASVERVIDDVLGSENSDEYRKEKDAL